MALAGSPHETGQSDLQNITLQKECVISVLAQTDLEPPLPSRLDFGIKTEDLGIELPFFTSLVGGLLGFVGSAVSVTTTCTAG